MDFPSLVGFIIWNNMGLDEQSEKKLTLIILSLVAIIVIGLFAFNFFYFQKHNNIKVIIQDKEDMMAGEIDQSEMKNITPVRIANFKEEFDKIKRELLNNDNFQNLETPELNWPLKDIESEKVERDNPFDSSQAVTKKNKFSGDFKERLDLKIEINNVDPIDSGINNEPELSRFGF